MQHFPSFVITQPTTELSTEGKSVVWIIQNQLKLHYVLGDRWGIIVILIISGQIAISLCSLRTHLLKEMAKMTQLGYKKLDLML